MFCFWQNRIQHSSKKTQFPGLLFRQVLQKQCLIKVGEKKHLLTAYILRNNSAKINYQNWFMFQSYSK